MQPLAHLLFGQTRSAVLGALLLRPEASLHVRELARVTDSAPGSLHRELRTLSDAGLLLREEIGRQVHYRANTDHPVYAELAALLLKTAGLVDVLREVLKPLDAKLDLAFVFGSMADGTAGPHSDVDVMLLGSASFVQLVRVLSEAQAKLRREVNPTVMTRSEFAKRLAQGDGFARSVLEGQKLWIKGEDSDLAELVEDRPAESPRAHAGRSAKADGRHSKKPQRRASY